MNSACVKCGGVFKAANEYIKVCPKCVAALQVNLLKVKGFGLNGVIQDNPSMINEHVTNRTWED